MNLSHVQCKICKQSAYKIMHGNRIDKSEQELY